MDCGTVVESPPREAHDVVCSAALREGDVLVIVLAEGSLIRGSRGRHGELGRDRDA